MYLAKPTVGAELTEPNQQALIVRQTWQIKKNQTQTDVKIQLPVLDSHCPLVFCTRQVFLCNIYVYLSF